MPVSKRRWLARGLLLLALSFTNFNIIWSPDVVPNSLLAWTFTQRTPFVFDTLTLPPTSLDRTSYFFRSCGSSSGTPAVATSDSLPRAVGGPPPPGPADHVCSIFPPGMGLLSLPMFLLLTSNEPDLTTVIQLGHLTGAFVEVLATLLLWSVLRRFVSVKAALGLILLYSLGTSVRTVSSQALWQHSGVHLALSLSLWLLVHESPVRKLHVFIASFVLGLGGLVRQTSVLFTPISFTTRKRVLVSLLGLTLGLLPLLAYSAFMFGNPLEQGYGAKPFDLASIVTGMYGLLLSPSRGLLIYEPFTLFAFAALLLSWKRPGNVASLLRRGSLSLLITLLLYATYAEWWGGRVFGPRFLDDGAPLLFTALAWGISQGLLNRQLYRRLFYLSAGWSLLLFNAAAFTYTNQTWDMNPTNINLDPARLFDWSNPQWLNVLANLTSSAAWLVALGSTFVLIGALTRLELRSPSEKPVASELL